MQEKSWLTTVIGIGVKGNLLLHEIQSRMIAEEMDAKKDEGMALCRYWSLSMDISVNTALLEQNCRDIAVAFLLIDISDAKNIKAAQEIGKFVSTQKSSVSIAILTGIHLTHASKDNLFSTIISSVDAVVDLNACMNTGGFADPYMAYSIVRGINGLIVKTGLVGLDVADLSEQFQKAGLLRIGFDTAISNEETAPMKVATQSALLQIAGIHASRVLLCMEGNEDTLELQDVAASADVVGDLMPDANILFGAAVSKSIGDRVRVLILASESHVI